MWLQVVGKLRLAAAPMVNHWWQATFYVTPRRLTTGSIPHGSRTFSVELDFHDHVLLVSSDDGRRGSVALEPKSVATFYGETMAALGDLGIETTISASPNEVDPAIPFAEDETHASYDASAAHLFWRQLVQVERVMRQFRGRFAGKVSPVHLVWGAMDLACTRFSGRTALEYEPVEGARPA